MHECASDMFCIGVLYALYTFSIHFLYPFYRLCISILYALYIHSIGFVYPFYMVEIWWGYGEYMVGQMDIECVNA